MTAFLTTLPALLGILGFVIYLLVKKSVAEDPVIKSIIDRLKYEQPDFASQWQGLTSKQKEQLLKDEQGFKDRISNTDRSILSKALSNQFRTNIFVYLLCGLLLVCGLFMFLKPKPLAIDSIQIQNTDTASADMIVDLDPLTVTWTSTGKDGEIYAVLENIETGKQTNRLRGLASDGKIKFECDKYTNYDKILSKRNPNETNRIRAILYAGGESFKSKDFEIKVGVKIICYERRPNTLVFNAIVDQVIMDNFHFAPRISLFTDEHFNGAAMFEAASYSPQPEIVIEHPANYATANLAFTVNPRDVINSRIYRTDVESIRDALIALKKK